MTPTHTPLPDVIPLRRSRRLALWIVLVAAAAAGLVWAFLPIVLSVTVNLLLAAYAWRTLRLYALLTAPAAVVAIRWRGAGVGYQLQTGQWVNGSLLNGGLVTPWVTLARVRDDPPQRQVRYIVLTSDNVSIADFRVSRRHMLWRQRDDEGAK